MCSADLQRGDGMNRSPSENEIKYIREALNQFNKGIVGDDGHTPLSIVEYDNDGNVIGGILGGTYWGVDVYRYSLGRRKTSKTRNWHKALA